MKNLLLLRNILLLFLIAFFLMGTSCGKKAPSGDKSSANTDVGGSSSGDGTTTDNTLEKALEAIRNGDYAKALEILRTLAEQGNADAQFNLGLMYAYGRGVPQDDAEAVKWFRKAADQGHARGQYSLGVMYENGRGGLTQDYTEAVKWYREAADQGLAQAQNNLGSMYQKGLGGLTQDYTEAVKWFTLAANQGYALGQSNLGIMYYNGWGVTQDHTEAAKWFTRSAEQNNSSGQSYLAVMYEKGQGGLAKNLVTAYMWIILSGRTGGTLKNTLEATLTPAQITQAQQLAAECRNKNYRGCG